MCGAVVYFILCSLLMHVGVVWWHAVYFILCSLLMHIGVVWWHVVW